MEDVSGVRENLAFVFEDLERLFGEFDLIEIFDHPNIPTNRSNR
jgi:hypothetical protein